MPCRQQRKRPAGDPRALGAGELLAIAADQLAAQRAAALGPERHMRRVAHVAVTAACGALLASAVDGHLGCVQIDGRRLAAVASQRPVQTLTRARSRALDPLAVHAPEALGVLQGRRRRRRGADRAQRGAGAVSAHVLDVVKERAADQLALSHRDHQLAGREAAAADLHRPGAPLHGQLGVDQPRQPEPVRQLARDRQPGVGGERRIIRADDQPSGASGTVNANHPPGDPASPSQPGLTTRTLTVKADGKAPCLRGFSNSRGPSHKPSPDPQQESATTTH